MSPYPGTVRTTGGADDAPRVVSPPRRRSPGWPCLLLATWLSGAATGAGEPPSRPESEGVRPGRPAVVGESPITALAFSPDGQFLLAASQRGVVQWSWPEWTRVRTFPNPWLALHDLEFSPAGDRLAVGGGDPAAFGGVAIWEWPAGKPLAEAVAHDDVVYGLAWEAGGAGLVTAAGDRTIRRWACHPELVPRGRDLAGHSRAVTAAAVLPRTSLLVTAGRDHSLRLWNSSDGTLLRTLDLHTGPVTALAVRPARPGPPWLVSCSEDRTVRFWQPTIGRLVRFVRLPSVPLAAVWMSDGEQVAVGCQDGRVRIISALGRGQIEEWEMLGGWAYALALAPDGRRLVVGGEQGELRVLGLHP